MADDRAAAIAARVRTVRGLIAYGGHEPDPLGITPSWVREATPQSQRLAAIADEITRVVYRGLNQAQAHLRSTVADPESEALNECVWMLERDAGALEDPDAAEVVLHALPETIAHAIWTRASSEGAPWLDRARVTWARVCELLRDDEMNA